jgi:hypothetical protein
MTHLSLAIFLIVFGLNILFGLPIPMWVTGLLAIFAGVMLVMRRFGLPKYRRQSRYPATRDG